MKKIYIFILGILLTFGLAAQPVRQSLKVQNFKQSLVKNLFDVKSDLKMNQILNPNTLNQEQLTLKNAVLKQKLDSLVSQSYDTINLVWKPNDTEAFFYDTKGKTTNYTSYSWHSQTSRKDPVNKVEYNYNASSYLTATHSFDWDTIANIPQWVETYKVLYSLNASNWVNESTSYFWDSDSLKLLLSNKTQYTYDSHGNALTQINSNWDGDLNVWSPSTRTVQTFDGNNNVLTSEYSLNMGGADWMLWSKTVNTYDSQSKLLTSIDYSLDYGTFSMAYSSKDVHTYNSNGDKTLTITSKWQASAWVNDSKEELTYDSNRKLLTDKEYDWDAVSGTWKPYWSEENNYDSNGNITVSVYNNGDAAGNWVKDTKTEIAYNNAYNSSDLIFPYIYGDVTGYIMKMITGLTDYQWKNGQWRYDSKSTFYYTGINITSVDKINDGTFTIYPNPVNEVLNIYSGSDLRHDVSLFSLDGNLVLKKQFNNQTTLQVGNLPSGIYVVKIKSPDKPEFMEKIVVK